MITCPVDRTLRTLINVLCVDAMLSPSKSRRMHAYVHNQVTRPKYVLRTDVMYQAWSDARGETRSTNLYGLLSLHTRPPAAGASRLSAHQKNLWLRRLARAGSAQMLTEINSSPTHISAKFCFSTRGLRQRALADPLSYVEAMGARDVAKHKGTPGIAGGEGAPMAFDVGDGACVLVTDAEMSAIDSPERLDLLLTPPFQEQGHEYCYSPASVMRLLRHWARVGEGEEDVAATLLQFCTAASDNVRMVTELLNLGLGIRDVCALTRDRLKPIYSNILNNL